MDRTVMVELPQSAIPNQTAEVIVLFENALPGNDRLAEFDAAMSDPLFLADLDEIRDDFRFADSDEVAR